MEKQQYYLVVGELIGLGQSSDNEALSVAVLDIGGKQQIAIPHGKPLSKQLAHHLFRQFRIVLEVV